MLGLYFVALLVIHVIQKFTVQAFPIQPPVGNDIYLQEPTSREQQPVTSAIGTDKANHDALAKQIPIDSSKYYGLTTLANLPYQYCLAPPEDAASTSGQPIDIAILGAPFDTATTARPGARFGPHAIRWASRRISRPFATDPYPPYDSPFSPDSNATIVDCGDARLTFLDNTVALTQLEMAHELIASHQVQNASLSPHPRTITLGGDHTTTLSALRALYSHWGRPVSVIHFDSHIDTWRPSVLGGTFSPYAGVNHGTFLSIASEEGLIWNASSASSSRPSSLSVLHRRRSLTSKDDVGEEWTSSDTKTKGPNVHVGIRAPIFLHPESDLDHDRACGFSIIYARDIDRIGSHGVARRILERVKGTHVYISVDIDVLDPAYAPGTGTPEVGGWSSRELLAVLQGLRGRGVQVVGADVVEVSPAYDSRGEVTGVVAAEVVRALIGLMGETPITTTQEMD